MKSPQIGRREFVTQIAATAATAMFAADSVAIAAAAKPTTLDVKTATSSTFKAVIGQRFKVAGNSAAFVLDKVEVVSDPNRAKRPNGIRNETFLLLLSAPNGSHLTEGTYTLANSTLGSFSVYLNEVRLPGTFTNVSALGQAELFVRKAVTNMQSTPARVYFQIPFS